MTFLLFGIALFIGPAALWLLGGMQARYTLFVLHLCPDLRPGILHVHVRKNIYFLIDLRVQGQPCASPEKRNMLKGTEIKKMVKIALDEMDMLAAAPAYRDKTMHLHSWMLQEHSYFARKIREKGFRPARKGLVDGLLIHLSYPFLVLYMKSIGHGEQVASPEAKQAHLQLWVREPGQA